jgi:2-polyprenyl-3-methyl-5-hydroxy-6-metoxy-1,4-benzoquinol methylase
MLPDLMPVSARRNPINCSSQGYHELVRRDVFPLLPGRLGRLLDVGGGIGATSGMLRSTGRADYAMLLDLVAGAPAPGIDKAIPGDLEDPSFIARAVAEGGPFDTILCLDVLEHLRNPWAAVAQLTEGLVPGGRLVISLPNVNYIGLVGPLVVKGRFELTDSGVMDRTHLRWFAKHGAIELATSTGLALEGFQPNIYGRFKRLLNALTFGFLTRFLAMQYVIVVRRPLGEVT